MRLTSQHTLRDVGRPEAAAYGTSGTIVNLAAVAARHAPRPRAGRDEPLTRKDLRAVAKRLRAMTADERRSVPGLTPARADIIVAGAAILDTLMEDLGIETIVALDDCGLREGLLLDDLARAGQHELRHGAGVRERSVLQLARSTSFDEPHARQVARLALELFDSARATGLHRLGPEERELLEYAALLHDIGTFLSYTRHHQHTYYLIRHADLVGFDQEEIAIMAATAYFHRKALPAPRFEAFSGLDRRSRKVVRRLGRVPAAGRVPRPRPRRRDRARAPAARGRQPPAGAPARRRLEPRGVGRRAAARQPREGVRLPARRDRRAAARLDCSGPAGAAARGGDALRRHSGWISAITAARSRLNSLPATVGHTSGKVSTRRSISSWRAREVAGGARRDDDLERTRAGRAPRAARCPR